MPISIIRRPNSKDEAALSSVESTTEGDVDIQDYSKSLKIDHFLTDSSESDTDSDKLISAPSTPAGVAPPPPLRNIPHQTTDTSPQASRVFSHPLMVRPSPSMQPVLQPLASNLSIKSIKIPSSAPQITGMRRPNPFPTSAQLPKASVGSLAGSGRVSVSDRQSQVTASSGQSFAPSVLNRQSVINPVSAVRPFGVVTPVSTVQSLVSSASHLQASADTSQFLSSTRVDKSAPTPLQASTPKSKDSLARDTADGKSGDWSSGKSEECTKNGEDEDGGQSNADRFEDEIISGGGSLKVGSSPDPGGVSNFNSHDEVQQIHPKRAIDFHSTGHMQKATSDNTMMSRVHETPLRASSANPTVVVSESRSFTKRKPPRAPSRLLQQSISQKSSSSDLSDDSTLSDNSEGRDKFDPGGCA